MRTGGQRCADMLAAVGVVVPAASAGAIMPAPRTQKLDITGVLNHR